MILGGPLAEEFGWSYLSDRFDQYLPAFPANLLAHNGLNFALSLVILVIPVEGNPQWRLLALGLGAGALVALLYRVASPAGRRPRLQAE